MHTALRTLLAVSAALMVLYPADPARAAELSQPIQDDFEKGMGAFAVRLADDGQGVILYDHTLIEDDGPGISSDAPWLGEKDRSPVEMIARQTRVRKILRLDRPEALHARLYVPEGVLVQVNGSPLGGPTNTETPQIDPALLKKGENEIILSPAGPEPPKNEKGEETPPPLKIATRQRILQNAPQRADAPPRSFKSADGGKTWQPVDGEFMVRLHLIQYAKEGTLIGPVIDLGSLADGGNLIQSPLWVQSVSLRTQAEQPAGTSIGLAVRSGPCPVYDEKLWTAWRAPDAPMPAGQRYLQWTAVLKTDNPTATPILKRVTVSARAAAEPAPAWAARVRVADSHNEEIRYTSMPFKYEDPNHPRMKALREKYKLDEVVAGAKTEIEKLTKLCNWVSRQWRYKPPENHYPAWDADEILTLKYGFCVQYAITYMQCATALGYQTRFVFGNNFSQGHEVCEVWSDEYGKWVFMDVNNNWHHVDPKTNVPMSLMEVRNLIHKTYYDGKVASRSIRPKTRVTSPLIATCYGEQVVPVAPKNERADAGGKDGAYYVPLKWMQLRYMDRNNFYSQPYPVPTCQGATWDYSDYWIWEDGKHSKQWIYRNYTARVSDLAWTINQVRFDAAWGEKADTVRVQMGTVTPHFERFLVNVDGAGWKPSACRFEWTLHPGKNRLEMRIRNTSGVEGIVSFLEVERAAD